MAKKANGSTAIEKIPSFLNVTPEGEVVQGMENVRPQDILIPRLILLQALSPSVAEGDKFNAGDIINSVSQELWAKREVPVEFIPIFHYLEWIEWGDRLLGESWTDRSLDPNGKLAQMSSRGEKKQNTKGEEVFAVTEYHNFVAMFPEISEEILVVISCAKSNHKRGKQLIALSRYRGRYPMFAGKYSLQSEIETNRQGQKYYTFSFNNAGWADKEHFDMCEKLYAGIKDAFDQRRLQADQLQEEKIGEEETEL